MRPPHPFVAELEAARAIAVLRSPAPVGDGVLAALTDAGLRLVEVTSATPGAADTVARWRAIAADGVSIGTGTVVTPDEAATAVRAGAQFLVTPNVDAEVLDVATAAGIPVVAGALSPTEVLTALRLGAAAVKVFPASAVGGPAYIRQLRGPLPHAPLVAVGGVGPGDAGDYLAAGCVAVGVGGAVVGDLSAGGEADRIRSRAQQLAAAVGVAR